MITKRESCLFLFLICVFATHVLMGSTNDSLKALISKSAEDSNKVNLLNALSKSYFNDDPLEAITQSENAKALAQKINYKKGIALAAKNIGIAYYMQGKYVEAIGNWNYARALFETIGDKAGAANILSNLGAIYFNQADDAKALEYYLQALKISEEINDSLRTATVLMNIGAVYVNKEATLDKALDYYLRSLPISEALNDNDAVGTVTANLGEIYYKKSDYPKALIYFQRSLRAYESSENIPYALNWTGRTYAKMNEFDKAIASQQEAFSIAKKLDAKLDMTQSTLWIAQTYAMKGDTKSAIDYYKQAEALGQAIRANQELKDIYQGLGTAYGQLSDFNNAYKYQTLLLGIKDTLYNIETDKKLGSLLFTYEIDKKQGQINLLTKDQQIKEQVIKRQKLIRNGFIGGFTVVALFAAIFFKQRNRISKEKKRSDELLLNILPSEVAEELKEKGSADAQQIDQVTVLFTDFKGFTQVSEKLTPRELVAEINECFSEFDHIMQRFGVEKIKTIGDAYMAAGGLPTPNKTHAADVVSAALEIQKFMDALKEKKRAAGKLFFEIRIGVHTGPVVAGIVGVKKFAYDIWGDTVNTASRMESSGEIGKVNISGTTYEMVKTLFACEHRGKIPAKNKGDIDMYFVS